MAGQAKLVFIGQLMLLSASVMDNIARVQIRVAMKNEPLHSFAMVTTNHCHDA